MQTQGCTLHPNRVRFYSLTVLRDSEPGRRAFAGNHLAVAATCAVLLAATGCGATSTKTVAPASTSAAPGTTSPGAWTGLGAKLADWETAHPRGPRKSDCSGEGCYGYGERIMASEESVSQFTSFSTTGAPDYRVDGYEQAIGDGTSLAVAKTDVLRLLPSDTRTTAFWIARGANGSCALWNLKSKTLGRWLGENKKVGDSQGALGVELNTLRSDGSSAFRTDDVSNASVSIAASPRATSC